MNGNDIHEWQDENLPFIKWWIERDGKLVGVCHMRTGHVIWVLNMLIANKKSAGRRWREWVCQRLHMELDVRGVNYERNKDNPEGPYK